MTTIRLFDTYSHIDGTPGRGHVYVRPVVTFTDGTRTVLDNWAPYELDAQGRLDATITWADHTDPSPVWLQVWESVDCARGHIWDLGPQLLTDGANLNLGALRELPVADVSPPRYQVAPAGPAGPPGPAGRDGADSTVPGPPGPAGPPGKDGSGVTIVGTVLTAADLPPTSTPGDMYIATDNGHGHTWDGAQWIDVGPIRGPKGDPGRDGVDGQPGQDGVDGDSAYELAVAAGFVGTEAEWLASLKGDKGDQGPPGASGGLPAGAADGDFLTWTATGAAWSDLPAQLRDDFELVMQGPLESWDAGRDYPEFSVVAANGRVWGALRHAPPGTEPGVDGRWVEIDLPGLLQRTKHWRVGPPADPADDGKVLVAGGGDATWQDPPPAGGGDGTTHHFLTQAEFDAIAVKDPDVLYIVTTAPAPAISPTPHVFMSDADYRALTPKDPDTLYITH